MARPDNPLPDATADMPPGLIADIGGTNARFALANALGGIRDERVLACKDHAGPLEAAQAYLAAIGYDGPPPLRAAFCVACPITEDRIALTNGPWAFSQQETKAALGLERLMLVNDFAAQALGVPHLGPKDIIAIAGPDRAAETVGAAPIAVIGPGTGLGVGLLVPGGHGRMIPVSTEGGHVTLAARTNHEAEVIAVMRRDRLGLDAENSDHVSAEACLSGTGLPGLYRAVCAVAGQDPEPLTAADIMDRGTIGQCPRCAETADLFFAFLGTVSGNLVLSGGTRSGCTLMGGILPRYVDALKASAFHDRFLDKGRFRAYMAAVPIQLGIHPFPALLGLAALTR